MRRCQSSGSLLTACSAASRSLPHCRIEFSCHHLVHCGVGMAISPNETLGWFASHGCCAYRRCLVHFLVVFTFYVLIFPLPSSSLFILFYTGKALPSFTLSSFTYPPLLNPHPPHPPLFPPLHRVRPAASATLALPPSTSPSTSLAASTASREPWRQVVSLAALLCVCSNAFEWDIGPSIRSTRCFRTFRHARTTPRVRIDRRRGALVLVDQSCPRGPCLNSGAIPFTSFHLLPLDAAAPPRSLTPRAPALTTWISLTAVPQARCASPLAISPHWRTRRRVGEGGGRAAGEW